MSAMDAPPNANTPSDDSGIEKPVINMAATHAEDPKIPPIKGATKKYKMKRGHTTIARISKMKNNITTYFCLFNEDRT